MPSMFQVAGLIWKLSTYGNFTFSSAYDALRSRAGTTLSSESIWAGRIPSKVSVFMWKLLRRLLLFPDVVENFGVCLPSVCPFCVNANASLEHCLLLCSRARGIWFYFGRIFGLSLQNSNSVRTTCHSWWLLSSHTLVVDIARLMSCLLLWFLWLAYNESIYEGSSFSPSGLIQRIKQESVLIFLTRSFRSHGASVWVKWLAPPSGRLKLNTNALFSSSGVVGGTCVRDYCGHMVAGLCFNISASSVLEVEALVLHFALQWCDTMVMFPALVEVDSLALVHLASSTTAKIPWKFKDAILFPRACLSSWGSSIRHVYREQTRLLMLLRQPVLTLAQPIFFAPLALCL
ncbi:PREDICTED: uncharacterized protein LOC109158451 [Ipomoea nil]|uniref:uncharacterized protein LOC109158451 n=1 Tax=Ipomoea nil TaxID=35883 RepID=UPI000900DB54|nr:PREDICTED: uncharacterized protein LOC109158451 [Ipomoea nil]